MSEAERMPTSSAVASDAEITAAWSTSAEVIRRGLVLSELHAPARTSASIGAPTMSDRFIGFSWVGVEGRGEATAEPRSWVFWVPALRRSTFDRARRYVI